jgi:3-hydroxy-9,10-secoandrosta-1,3,5(10)-triene-9,17-dione monooxygenase reductase component
MGETVRVSDLPDGMADDAYASPPPPETADSSPGDFPHDFEWRPGETIEVDDEEAQGQAQLFRDVLGRYASGVTVVTTLLDGQPVGMTCQSFTSVSLDPPLVAFLPSRQSRAIASIRRTGTFCVNFLADGQEELSDRFASRSDDKFAGVVGAAPPRTGGPEAGDHYLVIGRVVDLAVGEAENPLLYYRGAYRS